jgi:hypothetical protein
MRPLALAALTAVLVAAPTARADVDDAGAGAPSTVTGCVELLPLGMQRPLVTEKFPARARSGWATTLEVTVEHGKGESVLPAGLELQSSSEAFKELRAAGWVVPHPDGSAGARIRTEAKKDRPDRATTTLELSFVPLPPKPGRHELELPPLPIAVARASGDLATVCTSAHRVVVDDPTAETPDPKPKPNGPPLPQREEWTALRNALAVAAISAVLGAVALWLLRRWLSRPRPAPPPPPPRPPWEIALEQLDELRHSGLLETERYADYFDRVSDALRAYLGHRYGFDGLESTTDEILDRLHGAPLAGATVPEIAAVLKECDLVKFARSTPSPESCERVLSVAEHLVRATIPRPQSDGPTLEGAR